MWCEMLDRRRLAQAVRNRQIKTRSQPIFVSAERVLDRIARRTGLPQDVLIEAITGLVDEEFMKLCTLGRARNGILTVLVMDERLVSSLRARWGWDLVEGLRMLCPESGIGQVRFAVGCGRRLDRLEALPSGRAG